MQLHLHLPLSILISLYIEHHEYGKEKTHTTNTKDIHIPGNYECVRVAWQKGIIVMDGIKMANC